MSTYKNQRAKAAVSIAATVCFFTAGAQAADGCAQMESMRQVVRSGFAGVRTKITEGQEQLISPLSNADMCFIDRAPDQPLIACVWAESGASGRAQYNRVMANFSACYPDWTIVDFPDLKGSIAHKSVTSPDESEAWDVELAVHQGIPILYLTFTK